MAVAVAVLAVIELVLVCLFQRGQLTQLLSVVVAQAALGEVVLE